MFEPRIFIHIPKNAGMTIRNSRPLRQRILPVQKHTHKSREYTQGLLHTMAMTGDHHGIEHARWRDLDPSYTARHPAFAVVRNPWDRVVSRYFFAKKVIEVEGKENKDYADVSSFEAFLEERHKWGNQPYMWHRAIRGWYPAFDYVTDEQENIRCDIIRFEKLNGELCRYFGLLSMTRARNVTGLNTGTYRDLYNDKTRQIVADWYKKDIDTWGFDFDTSATKNTLYSEGL